ncbi:N-acetyl sugar amidotransferase [Sphingomonas sp. C3-2]|uniref:N-acetyl sugar amidotransferase n=1 Tax=Sphingomonas sp. C3-2 TaxID=3062169 RepID=UPI00294AF2A9|nr:N-acetyl sugar amidotransferase [Sphingomonas sp. C3-2]WOK35101.1 N-acetyl sugar amidotransferase [Sphingomonas sp. C3-2]
MTIDQKVFRCSNCLNMSTRPRIQFDTQGRCNACVWGEQKQLIDWSSRELELEALLAKHRRDDGWFDCIVPVSGGKDGSYVAYNLKHKYGMNPLAVTVTPALALDLGNQNLRNFINSGYNHVQISPDAEAMRSLNRTGFIEMGFPYYGWLIAIQSAVVRLAVQLGIELIFYGEDGEVEYGGSTETANRATYTVDYMRRVYLEGGHDTVLERSGLPNADLNFFRFPSNEELSKSNLEIAHWSYFENWDPYRNYLIAKEFCGLQEAEASNAGTFTNFAQNDQALYSLHTYLMYLKFGFGRATQDAGIEVRRGAMTREQALNLVRVYDNHYPEEFIKSYLEYYQITQAEFDAVLDRWTNKNLFEKIDGRWQPNFDAD